MIDCLTRCCGQQRVWERYQAARSRPDVWAWETLGHASDTGADWMRCARARHLHDMRLEMKSSMEMLTKLKVVALARADWFESLVAVKQPRKLPSLLEASE